MAPARIEEIVRRFKENGAKLLLENPANVRDLLHLIRPGVVEWIDFTHLTRTATTFVKRDYRHIESDLVLRAPLRRQPGDRRRRTITIYILIEHQTEPDRLITLRVLEYVVQIYAAQVRAWAREHPSLEHVRLQPVLPIVFYTGTRHWEALARLVDLIEMGELFEDVTPMLRPLFVNLREIPPERLEGEGGFFGWVLRLIQDQRARPESFQELLERVVQHLETMPAAERLRWLELLSYIHALVYHERQPPERPALQEVLDASVRTDEHRQEIFAMHRTIADELKAEGRKEERKASEVRVRRNILLLQLRKRFGELPQETVDAIEATRNVKHLNTWLERTVTAGSLADVQIGPAPGR
jgi:hypothetical protein